MTKMMKKLIEAAIALDWAVSVEEDSYYCSLSTTSPAGQDFSVNVEIKDEDWNESTEVFLDGLDYAIDSFDVSSEAYKWLDMNGHGTNGAPFDMKDVYDDAEACRDLLKQLYEELKSVESEED